MTIDNPWGRWALVGLAFVACLVVAGCAAPTAPSTTPNTTEVLNDTEVAYTESNNLEDDERPHGLTLRNSGGEVRTMELRIERENETIFHHSYEINPTDSVTGTLTYAGNYTVTVVSDDRVETVELPRSTFDCNSSGTEFIQSSSGLESQTVSTLMSCPEDTPQW